MDRGTKMNNAQNYANQRDVSAQFFYEKGITLGWRRE